MSIDSDDNVDKAFRASKLCYIARVSGNENTDIRHAIEVLSGPGICVEFSSTASIGGRCLDPDEPFMVRAKVSRGDERGELHVMQPFDPEASLREFGDYPVEALCATLINVARAIEIETNKSRKVSTKDV